MDAYRLFKTGIERGRPERPPQAEGLPHTLMDSSTSCIMIESDLSSKGGCLTTIRLWPAPEPLSGHTTKTPLAWAARLALRKLHFAAPEPYSATTPACPPRSHPDRTRDGPHSPLPVHGVHWAASRRKTRASRAAYSARGWPRRA